ncbi:MAG: thymidylate synthase [Patescibacteria group bacterium]
MLIITTDSVKKAYSETLHRLISESKKYDDPEIFREDIGVISIQGHGEHATPIALKKGKIVDPFPYTKYFPHITENLVEQEMQYWNQQFLDEDKLPQLVEYLRAFPMSKRGIILFWEDKYRDLSNGAVCEIAVFFRIKDRRLEMHAHMRANNAAFLLFMDIRILMGIQQIVAKDLGLGLGEYVHFVDSLHIYEAEKTEAINQSKMIATSDIWNTL